MIDDSLTLHRFFFNNLSIGKTGMRPLKYFIFKYEYTK